MKSFLTILWAVVLTLLSGGTLEAWHTSGCVYCDVNGNGEIDAEDTLFVGVTINIANEAGTFSASATSGSDGCFNIPLPNEPDTYVQSVDQASLGPEDNVVIPAGGEETFELTAESPIHEADVLVDSPSCGLGLCWMTGGGVKFEPIVGEDLASCDPGHGPVDTVGGNVFPSCDPDPGDGGNWNHISHSEQLHFHGTSVTEVDCGNVPGIEPGSESPETPFNFIEFHGEGTLKGIKGNKDDFGDVFFFGRVEDRNEPGSNGAKDGEDIDRYFLHVFSDSTDPVGSTLLLVDVDGDPATVDPITISGGNFQLHISSCDDPPNF